MGARINVAAVAFVAYIIAVMDWPKKCQYAMARPDPHHKINGLLTVPASR